MFEAANVRDWIWMPIVDPSGDKIGTMESIYYDTASDLPAFATVTAGLLGRSKLLFVPLDGATVSPKHLTVQYDKKVAKDAPSIDTDGELQSTDEAAIYRHYNLLYTQGPGGERKLGRR